MAFYFSIASSKGKKVQYSVLEVIKTIFSQEVFLNTLFEA